MAESVDLEAWLLNPLPIDDLIFDVDLALSTLTSTVTRETPELRRRSIDDNTSDTASPSLPLSRLPPVTPLTPLTPSSPSALSPSLAHLRQITPQSTTVVPLLGQSPAQLLYRGTTQEDDTLRALEQALFGPDGAPHSATHGATLGVPLDTTYNYDTFVPFDVQHAAPVTLQALKTPQAPQALQATNVQQAPKAPQAHSYTTARAAPLPTQSRFTALSVPPMPSVSTVPPMPSVSTVPSVPHVTLRPTVHPVPVVPMAPAIHSVTYVGRSEPVGHVTPMRPVAPVATAASPQPRVQGHVNSARHGLSVSHTPAAVVRTPSEVLARCQYVVQGVKSFLRVQFSPRAIAPAFRKAGIDEYVFMLPMHGRATGVVKMLNAYTAKPPGHISTPDDLQAFLSVKVQTAVQIVSKSDADQLVRWYDVFVHKTPHDAFCCYTFEGVQSAIHLMSMTRYSVWTTYLRFSQAFKHNETTLPLAVALCDVDVLRAAPRAWSSLHDMHDNTVLHYRCNDAPFVRLALELAPALFNVYNRDNKLPFDLCTDMNVLIYYPVPTALAAA